MFCHSIMIILGSMGYLTYFLLFHFFNCSTRTELQIHATLPFLLHHLVESCSWFGYRSVIFTLVDSRVYFIYFFATVVRHTLFSVPYRGLNRCQEVMLQQIRWIPFDNFHFLFNNALRRQHCSLCPWFEVRIGACVKFHRRPHTDCVYRGPVCCARISLRWDSNQWKINAVIAHKYTLLQTICYTRHERRWSSCYFSLLFLLLLWFSANKLRDHVPYTFHLNTDDSVSESALNRQYRKISSFCLSRVRLRKNVSYWLLSFKVRHVSTFTNAIERNQSNKSRSAQEKRERMPFHTFPSSIIIIISPKKFFRSFPVHFRLLCKASDECYKSMFFHFLLFVQLFIGDDLWWKLLHIVVYSLCADETFTPAFFIEFRVFFSSRTNSFGLRNKFRRFSVLFLFHWK